MKRCFYPPSSRRPAMKPQDRQECHAHETATESGPITRRTVLAGMAASILGDVQLPARAQEGNRSDDKPDGAKRGDGIPGPFPGRVVEVAHAGSVVGDAVQEPIAAAMVERGMRE